MPVEIKIRKGEIVDKALRRLKKKVDREGIIKDARSKRGYEKPCERRRRKGKVKAFNGGYIGLEDRIKHTEHALHILGA
jgi:small subunit ribosomal protein S21